MPEFGTQVYWHDIPGCPAPWSNEEERKRMWRISRCVVGAISDKRHLMDLPCAEVVLKRRRLRNKVPLYSLHWGIVLEPYLSPLHGLNMVMRELQVALVTVEEAERAVMAVHEEFNAMTQQQFMQSQRNSQGRVKMEFGTQQSNTAVVDLREAPLLEVVKILCVTRGLEVSRFSRADIYRRGRLGVADVLPKRRVIMAFDRSKPLFAFVTAVTVTNKYGETLNTRYLQLVAPTSNPVPWRRLLRSIMPKFPSNECVVVAIQRCNAGGVVPNDSSHGGGGEALNELLPGADVTECKRSCAEECEEAFSENSERLTFYDEEETCGEKMIFGSNPIFLEKDRLYDDPLFKTPVVCIRKISRNGRWIHDWIQRLVEYKARKQLYAI